MRGLPAWLRAALNSKLEYVSRTALRERAQAASRAYRAGGSSAVIGSDMDALAYAVARMPATYAAVRAALVQTMQIVPAFAPRSLLDIGAGPGTATWAALDCWPAVERALLLDRNAHLLALAQQFHASTGAPPLAVTTRQTDIAEAHALELHADVVLASYMLAEADRRFLPGIVEGVWALAKRLLVIVEPGTMEGFRRILACRDILLAQGARIIAPCSHEAGCPLAAKARWCHFAARLPRSRDHLVTKAASVPYEDEKFSYLVAGKDFPDLSRGLRILATPKVSKAGVALTLCAPDVPTQLVIERRRKEDYKAAKACDWGDAVADLIL